MSKRFRSYLDQALFVLLIMAGAAASAFFDVRAVSGAMAAGRLGLAATAVAAPPPQAPVAAASAAQRKHGGTLLARLTR